MVHRIAKCNHAEKKIDDRHCVWCVAGGADVLYFIATGLCQAIYQDKVHFIARRKRGWEFVTQKPAYRNSYVENPMVVR